MSDQLRRTRAFVERQVEPRSHPVAVEVSGSGPIADVSAVLAAPSAASVPSEAPDRFERGPRCHQA